MSKPKSGLFKRTKGAETKPNNYSELPSHTKLQNDLCNWAKNYKEGLSKKDQSLFTVATIVYDCETNKEYFGRNKGIHINHESKNLIIFGDATHKGLLPNESLNAYPLANCAEVDAINKALNDGAKLNNLFIKTINTTKSKFGTNKKACENCSYAFKGKIKENYSGWEDE
ncbi:MAG: hypothetical protein HUJ58_07180 [Erysipelotrichaceae bacterium]|nr:hypothetical protein [Erysipelotrichaceae bacterium]